MAKGKSSKVSKKHTEKVKEDQGIIQNLENQKIETQKMESSESIELKPCKGSITRILMDEGYEAYREYMKKQSLKYEENRQKWRQARMDEYSSLTERQSDLISFNVYEYILYHDTPWQSFEEFLNEKESVRIDKMERYGLIEKEEPEEERIYLPLSDTYITRKKVSEEEEEARMQNRYLENYYENDEDEYEESEYEWEEEYEDYESSDNEDDDFDYYMINN